MQLSPMPGIYKIENNETHEFYIGATRNIIKRKRGHYSSLRQQTHGNPKMQFAYNQGETFSFLVLEYFDLGTPDDTIIRREQEWMNFLHPTLNARNAIPLYGKESVLLRERSLSSKVGRIQTDSEKEKRSVSLKEYYATHDHVPIPLEKREQLSARMMGSGHHNWGKETPTEVKEKIANQLAWTYYMIDPEGNEVVIKNLAKFIRDTGNWGMAKLTSGKISYYKGWKIIKIDKPIPRGRKSIPHSHK